MDIKKKIININPGYDVVITYHDDIRRYYRLYDKHQDEMIVDSFNRDAFLIKVNKIVKLTNLQELLIASI